MARHPPSLFSIRDLHVSVAGKEVVRGVTLNIRPGEIHVIMGPNGAGKSSLVQALMGAPAFSVVRGKAELRGKNLLALKPEERAMAGLFLAFQHPRDIAGVSLRSFLFAAHKAQMSARDPRRKIVSPLQFQRLLSSKAAEIGLDAAFIERDTNLRLSGGEKKKAELLQLLMLEPLLALLDETDSGLDLDALRVLADGLKRIKKERARGSVPFSALIVTHNPRLLQHLIPDHVHVMVHGTIVESGGKALAQRLEKSGFARYVRQ